MDDLTILKQILTRLDELKDDVNNIKNDIKDIKSDVKDIKINQKELIGETRYGFEKVGEIDMQVRKLVEEKNNLNV